MGLKTNTVQGNSLFRFQLATGPNTLFRAGRRLHG